MEVKSMSKLNTIISRVVTDEQFRSSFLTDPVKACEGYDLSDAEIAELKSINLVEISAVNAELEERLSKSFINLPQLGEDEEMGHSDLHTSHDNDHNSSW